MEVSFFGTRVQARSRDQVRTYLDQALREGRPTKIYTPNTEIVMEAAKEAWIRDLLNSGDVRIADGIGLVIGAKLNKIPLEERVTGYDVSLDLLKFAQDQGYRVYFLGGKEPIAKEAGEEVQKDYPGLKLVGAHHGYFEKSKLGEDLTSDEKALIEEIRKLQPDIIFVGLGFPIQEVFIHKAMEVLKQGVWIGNGGVLNILAKEQKRAPDFFIRFHLEWFYRLVTNPSRWKRQLAIPKFLMRVIFKSNEVEIVREDLNTNESKSN